MAQIYKLPLVLEPQPEGGWTITCPLLPNLITEADTIGDVVPNVTDALECLVENDEEMMSKVRNVLQTVDLNKTILMEVLIEVGTV